MITAQFWWGFGAGVIVMLIGFAAVLILSAISLGDDDNEPSL